MFAELEKETPDFYSMCQTFVQHFTLVCRKFSCTCAQV